MGQLIDFGMRVPKIGIERFDCAAGVIVKALFVNYNKPYARNLAFDEVNRCFVECTKEMAIKYRLNPQPRYYFLVAAFQTDMAGNILGDKEAKVTYMSMSNNQYEHFLAASNNLDEWKGLVTLTKVSQKGKDGRDFSFIEATPASRNAQGFKDISPALGQRLNSLIADNEMLNTAIQLIDAATGLYEEQYLERIAQNQAKANEAPQAIPQNTQPQGNTMYVTAPQTPQPQAIPQPTATQTMPSNPNVVQPTTTVANNNAVADIAPVEDLPF